MQTIAKRIAAVKTSAARTGETGTFITFVTPGRQKKRKRINPLRTRKKFYRFSSSRILMHFRFVVDVAEKHTANKVSDMFVFKTIFFREHERRMIREKKLENIS